MNDERKPPDGPYNVAHEIICPICGFTFDYDVAWELFNDPELEDALVRVECESCSTMLAITCVASAVYTTRLDDSQKAEL